jgi:hypothetical protein
MTSDGGVTWTDIPGAAATTYTPPAGSAGRQLRVLVTGTNGDGNSQAASPPSAIILADLPVNTIPPTLTGTAQDGQPLGLNIGTWTGLATITYTYQWQLSTNGGATWTDIAGATATTYTPPTGSVGKRARVLVTGTNTDGNSQAASPASAPILAKLPDQQLEVRRPQRHSPLPLSLRHRRLRRSNNRQPCRQNRLPSGPSPSANSPSPSKRSRTWETKGQARASATPVAPGAAVAATRASLSFDVFGVVNRVRITPAKI